MDGERTLTVTALEEAILHLERATAPWNIQMEVAARGALDAERLASALRAACARHPLARARLRRGAAGEDADRWFVPDALDVEPLTVVECPDDAALARARTSLYDTGLDLDVSPPLRAVLARRPAGDLVALSISHVASDGVGCHRFAQSLTRAYREADDPVDPLSLAEARALERHLAPADWRERAARAGEALRRLSEAADPPLRIALDGGAERDGYGFVTRTLDPARTRTLLDRRPSGASVNDVLVAASALAVERWNREHGESGDGRISVEMPVNTRPREWFWEIVGNYASFVTISTAAEDRTELASAVAAVRAQTDPERRARRAGGLYDLARVARALPLGVRRRAVTLLPRIGRRLIDTVVVSNLGRLPDPPRFDGEEPPELWFSPPCLMPIGVGIGAATVGGSLHLAVRHRLAQFDAPAAGGFADLLVEQLGVVIRQSPSRSTAVHHHRRHPCPTRPTGSPRSSARRPRA